MSTELVVTWSSSVTAWLMEHYLDALAALAPLGFRPSFKVLEMHCATQPLISSSDGKVENTVATVRVYPYMPGFRAKFALTAPVYVEYNSVNRVQAEYDNLEDLLKDLSVLLK